MSVVMSAESAQRLKARAAESGLHQSDSGLASESQLLFDPNILVSCSLFSAGSLPKCTACQARCYSCRPFIKQCHFEAAVAWHHSVMLT